MCINKTTVIKYINLKEIILFLIFSCTSPSVFSGNYNSGVHSFIPDTIISAGTAFSGNDSVITLKDSVNPSNTDDSIIANDLPVIQTGNPAALAAGVDSAIIYTIPDGNIVVKGSDTFKPNPKTAYLIATVFPGFGQIYNRQYWKLPLVYSGVVGFIYAITWNNKNYSDYRTAYFDLYDDRRNDPAGEKPESWSRSWQDFLPSTIDPKNYFTSSFQEQLKSGKDFYRRYRDLSIILSVVFYAICVADSYVDAQMFDFDVSPDLSFRVVPEIRPSTMTGSLSFGLNVSMTF
jgi:hypothetical protein